MYFSVFPNSRTGAQLVDIRKWIVNDGKPTVPMSGRMPGRYNTGVCLDPQVFKQMMADPTLESALAQKLGFASQFGNGGVRVSLTPSGGEGLTVAIDSKGNGIHLSESQWAALKTCSV